MFARMTRQPHRKVVTSSISESMSCLRLDWTLLMSQFIVDSSLIGVLEGWEGRGLVGRPRGLPLP